MESISLVKEENAKITGYANGTLLPAEEEHNLLSNITRTLNETHGVNLTGMPYNRVNR